MVNSLSLRSVGALRFVRENTFRVVLQQQIEVAEFAVGPRVDQIIRPNIL